MNENLHELLQIATLYLSKYLKKVLPKLDKNWWQKNVISSLSYRQKQIIKRKNIDSLTGLDLAALLRIFDNNWHSISKMEELTREHRHFVKEMQTIRNRWAHVKAEGFKADDIYRDLDTLQRFSKVIKADKEFINKIKKAKKTFLNNQVTDFKSKEYKAESIEEEKEDRTLKPGQIVQVKSDPDKLGAIVSIQKGEEEDRCEVLIDGKRKTLYTSQIIVQPKQDKDKFAIASKNEFYSYLTSLLIRNPSLSTLYSLNAARIDFIPYQFRPVLKFIRSDRPRLLIADGVGVGKTIEAGLILQELQARHDINSVLIICPKPLITERKWQDEMKRFDEYFLHLDGKKLRYCVNEMDMEGFWPNQYQKSILPYSLFDEDFLYGTNNNSSRKYKKGLLELDPPPRFDLVIVDEAHHIRNTGTYRHKAVKYLCNNAEAAIFLTATPIQMGNNDLFVLLNTLRPDLIIDQESFEHMSKPNPYINRASSIVRNQNEKWKIKASKELEKTVKTAWGNSLLKDNPKFKKISKKLSKENLLPEERVQTLTDIESLHTFSGIINRTRRKDIGDFTIRKPESVRIEFTPEQKQFYKNLMNIQARIFRRLHGDKNVNFMMTTIRRQAASSLFGLVPFLDTILTRHIDELEWDEIDQLEDLPSNKTIENLKHDIKDILAQAKKLPSNDPKLNALKNIIQDKQKLSNNKVMVFSSFRHSLYYIYNSLMKEGYRVGLIHGGVSENDRVDLRNRFELDKDNDNALDILLFSEIGSEGLDYQFCDCIINYDLPWNPMRIEQRIGRIDRNGQESETIAIFNLIMKGTVDADIYERCLLRIGVFNRAIGGSEKILGEITKEIRDVAENFDMNEKERQEKLQQIADNKIRLIQEQEKFEEKQAELFGINFPQEQLKNDIDEASSYWLSPSLIKNLIENYLKRICNDNSEFILGEKPLKTLRLSKNNRRKLLKDFKKLNWQKSRSYRKWEQWLKGDDQHLTITFDMNTASKNRDAQFIVPVHPLVKQAAKSLDINKKIITTLKVRDKNLPEDDHLFVIYQWRYHGIKDDLILQPVSDSNQITDKLENLLKKAERYPIDKENIPDLSSWEKLDDRHHDIWKEAKNKHIQDTKELAEYRLESLKTSHRARVGILEDQLSKTSNEKIKRMKRSQINSAEEEFARRTQEIEIAIERADITAQPVAYGILKV